MHVQVTLHQADQRRGRAEQIQARPEVGRELRHGHVEEEAREGAETVTGNDHEVKTSQSADIFHDIAQNRPSESAEKSGPHYFSARVYLHAPEPAAQRETRRRAHVMSRARSEKGRTVLFAELEARHAALT